MAAGDEPHESTRQPADDTGVISVMDGVSGHGDVENFIDQRQKKAACADY